MQAESIFYRPDNSYFYFPPAQSVKDKRLVFLGTVSHTPKEKKFIEDFRKYLVKVKSEFQLSDEKIVLFGSDKQFKLEGTYEALKADQVWRKTNIPIKLTPQIQQILTGGIIYATGRDHLYRPIVVMNLNLFDEKKTELTIQAFSYFFEQLISKALLPGQVEQWVTIMNIKGFSLFSLPLGGGRKLLNHLETHYRGRLAKLYLVNCPSAVWISWKIVKAFLEDSTVQKVNIIKDNDIVELYKHCNKSQIQKQFGGTQADRKNFWPGQKSPEEFTTSSTENHISKEEYKKRVPTLRNHIIHPDFRVQQESSNGSQSNKTVQKRPTQDPFKTST